MPITKPAAAWRVRRKQSSSSATGNGRMKKTKTNASMRSLDVACSIEKL
jgi:hypothetical protein